MNNLMEFFNKKPKTAMEKEYQKQLRILCKVKLDKLMEINKIDDDITKILSYMPIYGK